MSLRHANVAMRTRSLRRRAWLALTLVACGQGCDYSDRYVVGRLDSRPEGDSGQVVGVPWGAYASTLDVPAFPVGEVWTVDTAAEELDGGASIAERGQAGALLSLAEALWLSANRPGPDMVLFDADVFPVDMPQRIRMSTDVAQPGNLDGVCLDGRGRGVILSWRDATCSSPMACVWTNVINASLVVGVQFEDMPHPFAVTASQVAGCRFTSTYQGVRAGADAVIGPGNVFLGTNITGVEVSAFVSTSATVRGNYFGFDPRTDEVSRANAGVSVLRSVLIEDNVFSNTVLKPIIGNPVESTDHVTVKNNRFGITVSGDALPGEAGGIGMIQSGRFTLGPGNVVTGAQGYGVLIGSGQTAIVEITRNSIYGNAAGGISYMDPRFDPPLPAISAADAAHIEGTCPIAGRVEVFSDVAAEAEFFLGEAACDGVNPWRIDLAVPRGRNVTATLTGADARTSELTAPVAIP